jgi:hypothetical protein
MLLFILAAFNMVLADVLAEKYIISLKTGADIAKFNDVVASLEKIGAKVTARLPMIDAISIEIPAKAMSVLKAASTVLNFEKDQIITL